MAKTKVTARQSISGLPTNHVVRKSNVNMTYNESSPVPIFPSHISMADASKLNINDRIDHRDDCGRFLLSSIIDKKSTNLRIHYEGWSKKWDVWCDFAVEIYRFAVAGSISRRPFHSERSFKKGDEININPLQKHSMWKRGNIREMDTLSGQIRVAYNDSNNFCGTGKMVSYWVHPDNAKEVSIVAQDTNKRKLSAVAMSYAATHIQPMKRRKLTECDGKYEMILNEKINQAINQYIDNKNNKNQEEMKILKKESMELKDIIKNKEKTNGAMVKELKKLKEESEKMYTEQKKECEKLRSELTLYTGESERINTLNLVELNDLEMKLQCGFNCVQHARERLLDDNYKCIACKDRNKNVYFADGCDHIALCEKCEKQLDKDKKGCPICQKPYTQIKILQI